jgi:hypothetical protein
MSHPFPRLRWVALVWLAVYVPSYAVAYGWWNFLFLCNLGIFLSAVGFLFDSRLLLSSQALSALPIGFVWTLDYLGRVVTGEHVVGVTSYMWDPQYPFFTRALSLYHLAWPLLLLWCLRRVGYDRRGWRLQAAIATAILGLCWALSPVADNINYVFRDPFANRTLGPPLVHLGLVLLVWVGVVYRATHWLLRAKLPPPENAPAGE